MTKIAVLLSTYNGQKYLKQQLDSIFAQTYQDFTLFVRDDGSVDETLEILNQYNLKHDNLTLIEDEIKHRGASASFMWLMNKVDSEYFMFCDQDDVWLPNKIEIQYDVIQGVVKMDKSPIVVFHDLTLTNVEGEIIADSFWKMHSMNVWTEKFESLFIKNVLTGCSCLINNNMKEQLAKYNVENMVMYDHIISLIAYSFGKVVPLDRQLILYRDHTNSVTPKLNVSFKYRIYNFMKNINKSNYLMSNINQLQEFVDTYHKYMSKNQLSVAYKFISFQNDNAFVRLLKQKLLTK